MCFYSYLKLLAKYLLLKIAELRCVPRRLYLTQLDFFQGQIEQIVCEVG